MVSPYSNSAYPNNGASRGKEHGKLYGSWGLYRVYVTCLWLAGNEGMEKTMETNMFFGA